MLPQKFYFRKLIGIGKVREYSNAVIQSLTILRGAIITADEKN